MPTSGVFSIASITKTFVASAVLKLVREGRLALDDTIEDWRPDVPSAAQITIATATLVGHDGSVVGSRTILGYAPDTGVTVVVHANVDEISNNALGRIAVGLVTLADP